MRFAIIAAGEGARLKEEGITTPKPLISINGEKLIDRLIRIFTENGATEIVVICNELYPEVAEHLTQLKGKGLPLTIKVKTTASSMHSFHEIAPLMGNDRFILTTVDTIFDERLFADYVKAFQSSSADGMMAVTDYCDDEKPLYVSTDKDGIITGFHDSKPDGCRYVSAGIYGLNHNAITILEQCVKKGQSRMRNFQRALVSNNLRLTAYPLGKVFDIDHRQDIERAQQHVSRHDIVGIYRAQRFSPGSIGKDRAIMDATLERLRKKGYKTETLTEEELVASGNLPEASCYVSMARSEEALQLLQGKPCINSAESVRYCNHRRYIADDHNNTIPPLWIKRTDQCREQEGDVVYCANEDDIKEAKARLHSRGITSYVMQPHYEGEHVKFYAVSDTSFFYPSGHEKLKSIATAMAGTAGLTVYGGDAIISADGAVHIIDLNDFPSFSPCRDEAAEAIAVHSSSSGALRRAELGA